MTARAKARTCTLAGTVLAAAGLYAATVQAVLAIPGTAGAICLWMVAASYRADHRRNVTAFEAAREEIPYPDPQPMPDYDRIAEQAAFDETFGDMISNWNEDAA